jgi:FMN-dependent NADH-azoreductase
MNILHTQSSPGDGVLDSNAFVNACLSPKGAITVDALDVWTAGLPEFDCEAIGAKYKAIKHAEMTSKEVSGLGHESLSPDAFDGD